MPSKKTQNLDTTMKVGNWIENTDLRPFIANQTPQTGSVLFPFYSANIDWIGSRPNTFFAQWGRMQVTGTVLGYVGFDTYGYCRDRICKYYDDFLGATVNTAFWTFQDVGTNIHTLIQSAYGNLQIDMAATNGATTIMTPGWRMVSIDSSNKAEFRTIMSVDAASTFGTQQFNFGINNGNITEAAFFYVDVTAATQATWGIRTQTNTLTNYTALNTGVTCVAGLPYQLELTHKNNEICFRIIENGTERYFATVVTTLPTSSALLTPYYRFFSYDTARHVYDIDMFDMALWRNRQVL